jgi:predicted nucleic acid-binding protein
MKDKVFVDTNILIYAYDLDAGSKNQRARALMESLWEEGNGLLSTQVLQEFYVNVTRKILSPLSRTQARTILYNYITWPIVVIDPELVLSATEIEERYRLSFWDAMIIIAAKNANAVKIVTEDLNHGQVIEGILIENPFLVV